MTFVVVAAAARGARAVSGNVSDAISASAHIHASRGRARIGAARRGPRRPGSSRFGRGRGRASPSPRLIAPHARRDNQTPRTLRGPSYGGRSLVARVPVQRAAVASSWWVISTADASGATSVELLSRDADPADLGQGPRRWPWRRQAPHAERHHPRIGARRWTRRQASLPRGGAQDIDGEPRRGHLHRPVRGMTAREPHVEHGLS
jgi:hypothetical protein